MRTMRLSVAALGFVALSACSLHDKVPTTEAALAGLETREFDLAGFDKIEIDANLAIHVRHGDTRTVRIATEPDHFKALDIAVDGDTLVIDHRKKHYRHRRHVRVDITTPRLSALRVNGVIEGNFEGIEETDFDLNFSGIGELNIDGSCGTGRFEVSGIGEINLGNLKCRNLRADISGIGDVNLFAGETIDLRVSGIGDVTVRGNPRVLSLKNSGIGDVDFR